MTIAVPPVPSRRTPRRSGLTLPREVRAARKAATYRSSSASSLGVPGARRARTSSSSVPVVQVVRSAHHSPPRTDRTRGSRDSDRSARCTATRTVPGFLPTRSATCCTSSPATTRSITISAWAGGSVRTRSSARAGRVLLDHVLLRARRDRVLARGGRVGHRDGRPCGRGAAGVDRPVPGDREEPAAELLQPAGEPVEVADHLQPRLARDVLGVLRCRGRRGTSATAGAAPATASRSRPRRRRAPARAQLEDPVRPWGTGRGPRRSAGSSGGRSLLGDRAAGGRREQRTAGERQLVRRARRERLVEASPGRAPP